MENSTRNNQENSWQGMSGYVWSLIGSAVGFANILSFSAKAYFYGGGAFLVPFIIATVIIGIPLLCLEGIIGQHFHAPLVSAYNAVAGKIGKFFGWLTIMAVTTIGGYYILLTGWTVAYTYFVATDTIPTDTATFLNTVFLQKTAHITSWGSFAGFMFGCTAIVALFSWYVVSRNIHAGIERLCTIFLPLLAIMVGIFTVIVSFLPGAWNGIAHYLIPDFSVLKNPRLWLDACGHIFFSLSLGLGIITGYSRYANKSINIVRSMVYVTLGDFLISFIAGFAVFGCIGYMSHITQTSFSHLVTSASPFEIGFVVFPTILKTFGSWLYPIVGVLFFFSIFIAGVTGVFSIVESVAGNIEVEFSKSRTTAVTIAIGIMTILAAIFCMGNGQYLIGALDPMVSGFNMLISGIAEIVVFTWISTSFIRLNAWRNANGKPNYLYYAVRYIIPMILMSVFVTALHVECTEPFECGKMVRWGWLLVASIISIVMSLRKSNH